MCVFYACVSFICVCVCVCSSGLLPHAVLPPSLDHNYAQWQEREEQSRAEQPPLMKKIIPAPRPKTPGEPDSPTFPAPPPHLPPPPPLLHGEGCRRCHRLSSGSALLSVLLVVMCVRVFHSDRPGS